MKTMLIYLFVVVWVIAVLAILFIIIRSIYVAIKYYDRKTGRIKCFECRKIPSDIYYTEHWYGITYECLECSKKSWDDDRANYK